MKMNNKQVESFQQTYLRKARVGKDWRKLHNKELHNLHSSLNTVRVITSSRMRWVRHATFIEKMKNIYKILNGNMKEIDKL
jgi:hypothetical protein